MSRIEQPFDGISLADHAGIDHTLLGLLATAAHTLGIHTSLGLLSSLQSAYVRQTTIPTSISLNPGFTPLFGCIFQATNYPFIELNGSFGFFLGAAVNQNARFVSSSNVSFGSCAGTRGSDWRCSVFTSSAVTVQRVAGSDGIGEATLMVVGY